MREAAARRRATAATRCALHGTCHACEGGAASCLSQLVTPAHATPGLSAAEASLACSVVRPMAVAGALARVALGRIVMPGISVAVGFVRSITFLGQRDCVHLCRDAPHALLRRTQTTKTLQEALIRLV